MDVLLLTLLNAAVCVALPKLAWKILTLRVTLTLPRGSTSAKPKSEMTTFPYCTTDMLTGRAVCRFRPQFCAKCLPY